ncbi:MAG TPA: hypothetical protein VKA49_18855 [Flavitalea sp.]|nr:hypothetical protein [Flavitalea sp.]
MLRSNRIHIVYTILSCIITHACITSHKAFSQIPDFSKAWYLQPEDSANITHLIHNGVKVEEGKVIAWFPKDSLSMKRMKEIVDTLNIGIDGAVKFIKAPLPWQVIQGGDKYTYYFTTDTIISHGSLAGFVSISFWRIKSGKAPWLHEAIHEMLNTKTFYSLPEKEKTAIVSHLWLAEGLPEYIAMQVSQAKKLPRFDPLANNFVDNIDSACKEGLKNEKKEYILSFIGKKGEMPELFGKERRLYAPTFYHCSCSFVKYLVEQQGIEPLLNSSSVYPKEDEALKKLIRPSLEVMKRSWLQKLGID